MENFISPCVGNRPPFPAAAACCVTGPIDSVKAASHAGRVLFLRDGQVYHQLYRGGESQEAQFRRISDTLTVLAGGGEPHA